MPEHLDTHCSLQQRATWVHSKLNDWINREAARGDSTHLQTLLVLQDLIEGRVTLPKETE
jgi:hypothetical protein